jgi:ubiquinone/menaquinone biosynthesis C-methylase UbiE
MEKFDPYQATKENYERGDTWHREKSLSYDWGKQVERFIVHLPPRAKVLDVGCGSSARDILDFKQRGIPVEGLDYSETAIAEMRGRYPEMKLHLADMGHTEFGNASFGGIWACASLLNIPKVKVPAVLREFRRLLPTNGALFISVKEDEKERERVVPDRAGERFFSFFSEAELRQLVTESGFKVDHLEIRDDSDFTGKAMQPKPPRWICLYARAIDA